ncbi:MAG: hypothetical protein DRJ47_00600 [Thermoprotei archaeon]|nr:MAG: hypothetical protein DRJ47_00600 [Thermoprotei archaeon]
MKAFTYLFILLVVSLTSSIFLVQLKVLESNTVLTPVDPETVVRVHEILERFKPFRLPREADLTVKETFILISGIPLKATLIEWDWLVSAVYSNDTEGLWGLKWIIEGRFHVLIYSRILVKQQGDRLIIFYVNASKNTLTVFYPYTLIRYQITLMNPTIETVFGEYRFNGIFEIYVIEVKI